jgi:16S rRNA G527 N7-methylase RsmG
LEDFAPKQRERFDVGTSRAVGKLERLAPLTAQCLKPGGRIFLWLTREQAANVRQTMPEVGWRDPLPIPLSRSGVILPGEC